MTETQAPACLEGTSQQPLREQEGNLMKHLGPMKKDIQDMTHDITGLKTGQRNLESRVSAMEVGGGGGGGGESWKPTFVEIMRFCKWEGR